MKKHNLVQVGAIGSEYYSIINGKIEKYKTYKELETKIAGIENFTVVNYGDNAILTIPKEEPKKRGRQTGFKLTTEKTERKVFSIRFKSENLDKLKTYCELNKISQGDFLEKLFESWLEKN